MNNKIRIAILDSGVNTNHPALSTANINGCSLKYDDETNSIYVGTDYMDEVGHGTAVASIIYSVVSEADIFMYKVLDSNLTINSNALMEILDYINQNEQYDLINLSLGSVECDSINKMQNICNELIEKGTIIVSAYDNNNAVSFPAAFDKVIGVDISSECKKVNEWEYIENSIVNLRGIGVMQRIPWIHPEYVVTCGTSMTCAYMTGYAARFMMEGFRTQQEILNTFRVRAKKIYTCPKKISIKPVETALHNCKKAAIFPINKEMHTLCAYSNLTFFQLTAAYDMRFSGHIGKKLEQYIKYKDVPDLTIENINNIDYSCFDLLIVGHYQKMLDVVKKTDYVKGIIIRALELGKKVFMLDPPQDERLKLHPHVYYPYIEEENEYDEFQKLYYIHKPILGVVGTSSKQGKFTFQLEMRQHFLADGYKVGQLGTEPHSALFGINETFACGYNSNINMSLNGVVATVNRLMWNIALNDPDIIIVGSQAGMVPDNMCDLNTYPLIHQVYLQAVRPDALFICVNPNDTMDRIKQCIKTAEGLSGGKVIGIVLYPQILEKRWQGDMHNYCSLSLEALNEFKQTYNKKLNLPIFVLGSKDDMDRAYNCAIDYFSC